MNSFKDKIRIVLLGIVVPFAIYIFSNMVVVLIINSILKSDSINIMVIQGIANIVSVVALVPYYIWFKNVYSIFDTKLEFLKVFYVIIISFALCIILNILIEFIPREQENIVSENIKKLSSEYTPLLSLAIVSITAPIIEELIFRGFFYDSIKIVSNDIIAIILTSITFGVFHFDLQQIIYAFIVGLLLGYLRFKFNNLLYPVIMHAMMNTTSLLIIPEISKNSSERSIIYNLFISFFILAFSIIRLKSNN